MERVEDPFWRTRCSGLTEIVIGWGRIWFACSLRSSLRRQVVSQRSRVCWRQVFLREMGGHTLSKTQIGILGGA
jgi:hypothetical protein